MSSTFSILSMISSNSRLSFCLLPLLSIRLYPTLDRDHCLSLTILLPGLVIDYTFARNTTGYLGFTPCYSWHLAGLCSVSGAWQQTLLLLVRGNFGFIFAFSFPFSLSFELYFWLIRLLFWLLPFRKYVLFLVEFLWFLFLVCASCLPIHMWYLLDCSRLITCDEHPKKLTVAQAATPTLNVPSEVRSHFRQRLTLEISPFNHNNYLWTLTADVVIKRYGDIQYTKLDILRYKLVRN